jgi:hypothetical protein
MVCGVHGATSRPHRNALCLDSSRGERGDESTDRDGETLRGLKALNAWMHEPQSTDQEQRVEREGPAA